MSDDPRNNIVGDVASTARVKVEWRGGRTMASLHHRLLRKVEARQRLLSGAAIEFDDGQNILLLSGTGPGDVVVTRKGADRYEISRGVADAVEADEVETAFLRLKIRQFAAGELDLGPAMNADEWAETMHRRLEKARQALEEAEGDLEQA
jgi:hypothetical protein